MTLSSSALREHMPIVDGFPRPQWEAIESLATGHADWVAAARAWMEETARHLGEPHAVCETDNFFLLSPLNPRQTGLVKTFTEKAWKQIGIKLEGLGESEVLGKAVVMLFDSHDRYYEYSEHFYSDGEHPISSGVFLNAEYGHTAIPFFDIPETEATLAHELTHCFLRGLPIPLWLNEGLAVTMEDEICANRPLRMDSQRLAEHAGPGGARRPSRISGADCRFSAWTKASISAMSSRATACARWRTTCRRSSSSPDPRRSKTAEKPQR